MIFVQKVMVVISLSCNFVLSSSAFLLAQEAKRIEPNHCAEGKDGQSILATCRVGQSIHTVEGDVLRVDYDYVSVQRSDGEELKMRIDEHTEMIGYVSPGQHVQAKVNEQTYALLIRLIDSP
jgi:hypothetical protein